MGDWFIRAGGWVLWALQPLINFGVPTATLIVSFLTDDPTVWMIVFFGGYLVVFLIIMLVMVPFLPSLVREWLEVRRQRRLDWV
jgi:hypothetical protein